MRVGRLRGWVGGGILGWRDEICGVDGAGVYFFDVCYERVEGYYCGGVMEEGESGFVVICRGRLGSTRGGGGWNEGGGLGMREGGGEETHVMKLGRNLRKGEDGHWIIRF